MNDETYIMQTRVKCDNPHCDNYVNYYDSEVCDICDKRFCYGCVADFIECHVCGRKLCKGCIREDKITSYSYDTCLDCVEQFKEQERKRMQNGC